MGEGELRPLRFLLGHTHLRGVGVRVGTHTWEMYGGWTEMQGRCSWGKALHLGGCAHVGVGVV